MAGSGKRVCHRCGRQFARLEHLQRHTRSHTKEKPFGCSVCPKTFTRKDLLKRHSRIYHSENPPSQNSQSGGPQQNNVAVAQSTSHALLSTTAPTNHNFVLIGNSEANDFAFSQDRHASFADRAVPVNHFGPIQADQGLHQPALWPSGLGHNEFTNSSVSDDFSSFVDSIGFPSSVFSNSYQPVPDWPSEQPFASQPGGPYLHRTGRNRDDAEAEDPHTEATPWASRMPSVQPEDPESNPGRLQKQPLKHASAQVTHDCREVMAQKLKAYTSLLPSNFKLPSRHTLTCFVTGYVKIFDQHYPLLHIPTLELQSLSLELFLSIAALGAQYYWERAKGFELFQVARTIVCDRLRGPTQNATSAIDQKEYLQAAQALILLIAVSMWSETGKAEAFSLRGLLEEVLQADALDVRLPENNDLWLDWKQYEEVKRTKLIAYAFFNLHTITYDVPPIMLHRDVDVNLASSESIWRASDAEKWRLLKTEEPPEVNFRTLFHDLFREVNDEGLPYLSSLSGHVLMHAIIQHMWLLQQAGNLPLQQTIASTTAATSVELALKRWRRCCEPDQSPTTDHSDSAGPMPFTSRALLRLAYIRLNIDSGSARSISTWDPEKIAASLYRQSPIERSDQMTKAAFHCAQGLGIPIKLGINFVAHTQVFYWSNQYALCSFECALLLTKWLEAVTIVGPNPPLTDQESKLLNFVVQLVNHTEYEAPREQLLWDNKHLSVIILRLWAKLFRNDSVWEIVELIGKSLQAYAGLLEQLLDKEALKLES